MTAEAIAARPFRVNFGWAVGGNIVYAGCQWGVLVTLAHLSRPEIVGQYALALAIVAPVIMLTNVSLRDLLATDGALRFSFGEYRQLRRWGLIAATLVVAAIVVAAGYRGAFAATIAFVLAAKLVESYSDLQIGVLLRFEVMDLSAISLVLRGIGIVIALGATYAFTRSLPAAAGAGALAWLAVLVLYDVPTARRVLASRVGPQPAPRPRAWRELLRQGLPLGATAMLISLAVNIPRFYVEHYLGKYQLGIFSALAYLIVGGRLLAVPLAQAASPRLGLAVALRDRRRFRRILSGLLLFGLVLGVAGILFAAVAGRLFLNILYGAAYAAHDTLLILFMVVAALGYIATFLETALTAMRRVHVQPVIISLSLIASVIVYQLRVPVDGLFGAGTAMVVGQIVEASVAAGAVLLAYRSAAELA